MVLEFCKESGLVLNSSKCEVFFINSTEQETASTFTEISTLLPGIKLINKVDLLGDTNFAVEFYEASNYIKVKYKSEVMSSYSEV